MVIGQFFIALVISAIAAYYSIIGLIAIFAAAAIPVIVMGTALEIGKITSASLVTYQLAKWKTSHKILSSICSAIAYVYYKHGYFWILIKSTH